MANSDGDFSMEAEAGKYRLVVQCLGYEPLRKELILPIKTAGFLDSRSIEPCSEGSRCSSEEYRAEGGPLYHVGHASAGRMVRNYCHRHRVSGSRMKLSR